MPAGEMEVTGASQPDVEMEITGASQPDVEVEVTYSQLAAPMVCEVSGSAPEVILITATYFQSVINVVKNWHNASLYDLRINGQLALGDDPDHERYCSYSVQKFLTQSRGMLHLHVRCNLHVRCIPRLTASIVQNLSV